MRDQEEDDEDEKLFAELQRVAAKLQRCTTTRRQGAQGHLRASAAVVDRAGHPGDTDTASLRLHLAAALGVEGEERDLPTAQRQAGQAWHWPNDEAPGARAPGSSWPDHRRAQTQQDPDRDLDVL